MLQRSKYHSLASTNERLHFIRIIGGHSDRLLIVVGPCSIHCPEQAIAYARLLKEHIPNWPNLLIVMRAYLYVLLAPVSSYKLY